MFQVSSFQCIRSLERQNVTEFLAFLQYLTNNINSNGSTLVKVIAAVLKFSPQQTQVVLERETQRKTLVSLLYKF